MAAPEGYTPLAIVGYTDKGTYNAGTTYNKYNVVLYDGSSYVAIKDGVTGVTPSNDGVNWRTFANGFPSNGVTTDNFQSTLGNYLVNNGTTTNSELALDARYGKTLQDSVDALNRNTYGLLVPSVQIPESSDLDKYTTPGQYLTASASVSQSIKNTPYTASGFKLTVEKLSVESHIMQIIKGVNATGIYIRVSDGSSWKEWRILTYQTTEMEL